MPQIENVIKTCLLGGGVRATVSDQSCHYFGGYYHVRIRVCADVPVSEGAFFSAAEYQDAVKSLGASVRFSRTLEKMAVPESELEDVRRHLLMSFDAHELPYLARSDFPDRFVQSEYRKALKSRAAFHR